MGKFVYHEIVTSERIVFVNSFYDEQLVDIWQRPADSSTFHIGAANDLNRASFSRSNLSEGGPKSNLSLIPQVQHGHVPGILRRGKRMATSNESDKKPTNRGLTVTRVIHASPEHVFQAWTNPQQLGQWWGPKRFTNPVCELDVRPEGAIRIEMRSPDGKVYPVTGVYREIAEPERLAFTGTALDAEGKPLFEVLVTANFLERDSLTLLRVNTRVVQTTGAASPFLKGMVTGWAQSLERLDMLLLRGEKRHSEARRR